MSFNVHFVDFVGPCHPVENPAIVNIKLYNIFYNYTYIIDI